MHFFFQVLLMIISFVLSLYGDIYRFKIGCTLMTNMINNSHKGQVKGPFKWISLHHTSEVIIDSLLHYLYRVMSDVIT